MKNSIYNEIKAKIDKSCLTNKNKEILHRINKLLSSFNNMPKKLQVPILILTKAIDNTDIIYIEELITEMLKKYDVYGGKLVDTVKLSDIYYKDLITKIEDKKAYKLILDKNLLNYGNINNYLNIIETAIDTSGVFILLECMQNTIEELKEHSICEKVDYCFSNNSNVGELAKRLLNRYEYNEIPTNIEQKELKAIIKDNLKSGIYKTDEMCLQYMYSKSLKSYNSSNKRFLNISDIPILKSNKEKQEVKSKVKLEDLEGIEYLKDEIDRIIKFVSFNNQVRKSNSNIPKENLNMCFLGNPGTGKTTVARLIAKEFYKNGIIKKDTVTEVLPNDLIGEYVGWTRRKTREILEKAKGGILFIDEAYQIASAKDNNSSYMQEALAELLKYMENPDNIVIFAGYKEEIEHMISINPGMKSRIGIKLEFKDYATDVLKRVLDTELEKYKLKLDLQANEKVVENIEDAKKNTEFGNCRYIINLAQEIIRNHINSNSRTKIIKSECIPVAEKSYQRTIGFST